MSQLTLVALRVCGAVLKPGYSNSVRLPGGDSQHLYHDNCHLAASARFVAEAPVGCGDCESSREGRASVKSPQMALFGELTGMEVKQEVEK